MSMLGFPLLLIPFAIYNIDRLPAAGRRAGPAAAGDRCTRRPAARSDAVAAGEHAGRGRRASVLFVEMLKAARAGHPLTLRRSRAVDGWCFIGMLGGVSCWSSRRRLGHSSSSLLGDELRRRGGRRHAGAARAAREAIVVHRQGTCARTRRAGAGARRAFARACLVLAPS